MVETILHVKSVSIREWTHRRSASKLLQLPIVPFVGMHIQLHTTEGDFEAQVEKIMYNEKERVLHTFVNVEYMVSTRFKNQSDLFDAVFSEASGYTLN